jgi:hypothetical protein
MKKATGASLGLGFFVGLGWFFFIYFVEPFGSVDLIGTLGMAFGFGFGTGVASFVMGQRRTKASTQAATGETRRSGRTG